MPTGTLPESAKTLWEKIYNESLSNGDSKEIAARKAWSGTKSAGWHKNKDGEWVKGKSDVFAEFSMSVSKVAFDKATQERHITLVASDTDPDLADEKMSKHLFQDFVNRIEQEIPIPEEFRSAICEENWCGGQPYLSISHYKSAGGKNVPGEIRVSYVDGNRFKSKAVLHDTVLGKAVFKSLNDDLMGKSEFDDRVRVSIGFLDLAHKHGDFLFERKSLTDVCPKCAEGEGNKEYWEGVLVHEAFTRKPMNPRTDVEVQKMAIMTKKDDAESIVGEEVLKELDLESKSQVADEELIIIKSDDMDEDMSSGTMMQHESATDENIWYLKVPTHDDKIVDEIRGIFEKSGLAWVEEATKTEGGCSHPASHYLVVEDAQKPSTWHLKVKDCSGKVDTRLLGAAKAALTVGYRGNKYAGPNKEEALAKLKRLYKSAGLEWKADLEEQMPDDVVVEPKVEETKVEEPKTPEPVVESAVDRAVAALKSKLAEVKAKGTVGDPALVEIQPAFNELGNAVKNDLAPKIDPATANIAEIVRSAIAEQMAQVVAPLQAEINELKTKSGIATMQKRDEGIVARSITLRPPLPTQQMVSPTLTKIQQIAYASTEPR
jgi:hypothetical protein